MEKPNVAFARRLQAAVERAGLQALSHEQMAARLARQGVGVRAQTVSNWLTGKHMPKLEWVPGLAALLGTDPCELVFGGRPSRAVADKRAPAYADGASSAQERQLLDGYASLDADQQALVRELIRVLTASGKTGKRPGRRKTSLREASVKAAS